MPHLDEGTIHAWLDGALSPDETARVEAHVAECATCAAAVAEARGLIAASSRILTALDDVPGEVVPSAGAVAGETSFAAAAARARRRPPFRAARYASIAAVVAFIAVTLVVVRETKSPALRVSSDAPTAASEAVTLQSKTAEPAATPSPGAADVAAAPPAAPQPASPPSTPRRFGEGAGAGGTVAGALRPPSAPELAAADKQANVPNEERLLRDSAQDFATRQEVTEGAAAAPAPPSLSKRAARARGVEMDSRVNIAQINGRVTDAAGAPIASAQVNVVGTNRAALTKEDGTFQIDSAPAGTQTVQARRLGYTGANKKVEANAGDTISVNLSLPRDAAQLSEVIVSGAAKSTDEFAEREIAGLTLLNSSDSVQNGRPVRRSIYQLRPGVTITLVERRTAVAQQAAPSSAAPSRRSAPARAGARGGAVMQLEARTDAKDTDASVNTIFWTGADGTEFTLSGPLPVAELEELRRRIQRN